MLSRLILCKCIRDLGSKFRIKIERNLIMAVIFTQGVGDGLG